jgi:creatinine amidohydrolase
MSDSRDTTDMTRMTTDEIRVAIAHGATTAIAVLEAQEQHGAHLPMATDSIWGAALGSMLATRLGNALLAPVLPVGFSPEHMHFAGSITLRSETFAAVVDDYITSLAHHGFERIVLVCSHGGNVFPMIEHLPALKTRHPNTLLIAYTELMEEVEAAAAVAAQFDVSLEEAGAHGGEWETSMMLAVEPDAVHRERAERGFIGDLGEVLDQINAEGIQTV